MQPLVTLLLPCAPALDGLAWMNSPLLEIRTAQRSCALAVAGGRVGHVEVGVLLGDHVDAVAGDVAGQVGLAVAAREVHDDARVGDDLDAVRGNLGLDHLPAADLDLQRHVLRAVGAVAERHPVELGVDVDRGARGVVLAGAPVHAGALRLVGQPGPAALDRRVGGDGDGLLDGGLVADRRVELDDDGRRDTDGLAVGQLESPVDRLGGRHGGELGRDRQPPCRRGRRPNRSRCRSRRSPAAR